MHKTLVAHESIFQEFQNDREWLNSIRVNLEAHIVNLLKDSDGDVDILAEKLENEGFSKSYNQFIILIAKQTNFEPNNEGEEK